MGLARLGGWCDPALSGYGTEAMFAFSPRDRDAWIAEVQAESRRLIAEARALKLEAAHRRAALRETLARPLPERIVKASRRGGRV